MATTYWIWSALESRHLSAGLSPTNANMHCISVSSDGCYIRHWLVHGDVTLAEQALMLNRICIHDAILSGVFLQNAVNSALQQRQDRRQQDYVGSMLWSQQLRATEYFSRWLELKETNKQT